MRMSEFFSYQHVRTQAWDEIQLGRTRNLSDRSLFDINGAGATAGEMVGAESSTGDATGLSDLVIFVLWLT